MRKMIINVIDKTPIKFTITKLIAYRSKTTRIFANKYSWTERISLLQKLQ